MECVICLCDVSDNDFIILECCKNYVHIECIYKWIQLNKKTNKDIDKCISCKNENDIIKNILYLDNIFDTSYIEIPDEEYYDNNITNNITNNSTINNSTLITIPNTAIYNPYYSVYTTCDILPRTILKMLIGCMCIFTLGFVIIICINDNDDN
tara:strand:- start:4130 stop:4588 length:459 start_codon:yes stop_codon:yes gene_type:complete